jgi:hypothetical protein
MPCIVHNVIKILINPTFYFCRNNTKWKGMLKLLSRMFQIWLAPPAKTRFVYKLFISCIGLQNTVVVPMHALFNNSLQEPSIWVTPNCWWDLSWEASQFLAPFWNWGLITTQYKLTLSRCLPLPPLSHLGFPDNYWRVFLHEISSTLVQSSEKHAQNNLDICSANSPSLKDIGNKKISLSHSKELIVSFKLYYRFVVSCLVLEIFRPKLMSCSPSWTNSWPH